MKRATLVIFPPGFFIGFDYYYAAKIIVFTHVGEEQKTSFEAEIKETNDKDAIEAGKEIAKTLNCDLDLECITGQFIKYENL